MTIAGYTLEGTVLQSVDKSKYLGETITEDLRWISHIINICTKANQPLVFSGEIYIPVSKMQKKANLQLTGVSSPGVR